MSRRSTYSKNTWIVTVVKVQYNLITRGFLYLVSVYILCTYCDYNCGGNWIEKKMGVFVVLLVRDTRVCEYLLLFQYDRYEISFWPRKMMLFIEWREGKNRMKERTNDSFFFPLFHSDFNYYSVIIGFLQEEIISWIFYEEKTKEHKILSFILSRVLGESSNVLIKFSKVN